MRALKRRGRGTLRPSQAGTNSPHCRQRLDTQATFTTTNTFTTPEAHAEGQAEQVPRMEVQAREVAFPMVPTSIAAATLDEEDGHGHERHRRQHGVLEDWRHAKQPSERRPGRGEGTSKQRA